MYDSFFLSKLSNIKNMGRKYCLRMSQIGLFFNCFKAHHYKKKYISIFVLIVDKFLPKVFINHIYVHKSSGHNKKNISINKKW